MEKNDRDSKKLFDFRKKYALEGDDDQVVLVLHVSNYNQLDIQAALDQCTRGGGYDEGIDGWCFNETKGELKIYQSKYTVSKGIAVAGLADLHRACNWIEPILVDGKVEKVPSNPHLYNLYSFLSSRVAFVKRISFVLATLLDANEFEDLPEYSDLKKGITASRLMLYSRERDIKIGVCIEMYEFEATLPSAIKRYPIKILESSTIVLRRNAYLNLAYIRLIDLIELYRQKGIFYLTRMSATL